MINLHLLIPFTVKYNVFFPNLFHLFIIYFYKSENRKKWDSYKYPHSRATYKKLLKE